MGPALPNPWHTIGYGIDDPDYSPPNHLLREGIGVVKPLGADFSNVRFRNKDEFDPEHLLPPTNDAPTERPVIDNTAPPIKYPPDKSIPLWIPPRPWTPGQPARGKSVEKSEADGTNGNLFASLDGDSQDSLAITTLSGSDDIWNGEDTISPDVALLDPVPSIGDVSTVVTGPDLDLFNSNTNVAGSTDFDWNTADLSGDGADLFATIGNGGDTNLFTDWATTRAKRAKRSPRDFRF